MRKTFKYRLFPTKAQRTTLQQMLNACCWVYNKTLEVRRDAWKERHETLRHYATGKLLTQWKQEEPWLQNGHTQAMQDAQGRVDFAFRSFFRRVHEGGQKPGYPRFKPIQRYDSFTYPQQYGNWRFLKNGRLRISKIGDMKIKLHRPIEGKQKTLTIRRDMIGNWYAYFSCIIETNPLPPTDNVVGVDVGLIHFAVLSNGEQVDNPRFFRQDEGVLAKAQRKISKTGKGTSERYKQMRAAQHIHQRITNRRHNFAHQLSRQFINRFQFIAFEDLDTQKMREGNLHNLNKSVSDAAWRQFIQACVSKAESAGRTIVLVDPRNTTQQCSGCGKIVHKNLSERVHSCPHCGLTLDRDHNAALNILARGLASIGNQSVEAP